MDGASVSGQGVDDLSSYGEVRLDAFLHQVSEPTPAPGGGSVAAITVALAAGLVQMSADLSVTHAPDAREIALQAHDGRLRAQQLADEDAAAYQAVIDASASSSASASGSASGSASSSAGDPEARRTRRRDALREATVVPVEISRLGADTAELGARLLGDANPNLRGDCIAGVLLAEAAARAAARLVAINATSVGGDRLLVEQAERHVRRAQAAAESVSG